MVKGGRTTYAPSKKRGKKELQMDEDRERAHGRPAPRRARRERVGKGTTAARIPTSFYKREGGGIFSDRGNVEELKSPMTTPEGLHQKRSKWQGLARGRDSLLGFDPEQRWWTPSCALVIREDEARSGRRKKRSKGSHPMPDVERTHADDEKEGR